ncbi:MAG: hypothetical protein GXO65_07435 [Euryarchaeota archaeon]|nr:hypothetical protein [Euryarchaeota archaeon]
MDQKTFIRQCPGHCVTAGKDCSLPGEVECAKQRKIRELIEDTEAVKAGLWFVAFQD